ncbi:MAG: peptidoglycan-binding protein [Candidatus Pacebacteria bacterium]|nr:peptidoglycan-binding protein [Candidatus Paceibacterota bacterium]
MATPQPAGQDSRRGLGSLFPFGGGSQISRDTDSGSGSFDDEPVEQVIELQPEARRSIFRISNRPVTAFTTQTRIFDMEVTREREVPAEDEEDEPTRETFTETVSAQETIVFFTDTRTGEKISVNLDNPTPEGEEVLTRATVERAREGFIAGSNNEFVVLRFLSTTTNAVETYVGRRDISEIPRRLCRENIIDTLSLNANNSQVRQLQEILVFRGLLSAAPTGRFDQVTRSALIVFQEERGLEANGTTDLLTREFLTRECIRIEGELQRLRNEPRSVTGVFLRQNIHSLVLSPDKTKIFYLLKVPQGSRGFIFDLATQREEQVFSSAFSEWFASWGSPSHITLYTAPSGLVDGFVYEMNVATRAFRRITGDITGITALANPSNTHTLITEGGRNRMRMLIHSQIDGTSNMINLNTFIEKCVWENDDILWCAVPETLDRTRVFPDAWYRGVFTATDSIWRIDTTNGSTRKVVDAAGFPEQIDVSDIMLTEKRDYLLIRNRRDNVLWGIELGFFIR